MRGQARTRVIADQVWEGGELFASPAQPHHCIVLLMTLARGTLYAEQAIHCEARHNSTFTRVHLIACYACTFCNIVAVASRADICRQLEEGEVKRSREEPANSLHCTVGGNLEDRGDTWEPTKPVQNQSKPVTIQNQTKPIFRVEKTPVSIPYCITPEQGLWPLPFLVKPF